MFFVDWEGSWVFASTTLVVKLTAVYLAGYIDCLTDGRVSVRLQ